MFAASGIVGSEPVPTFGFVYSVGLEPIYVNLDRMIEKFKLGVNELDGLYASFLSTENLDFLRGLARQTRDGFVFPDEHWVKTIFHFALACHQRIMSHEHIIKSLTPIYIGKVASFVIETWESSAEEVEARLELLCLAYEKLKGYLVERWEGAGIQPQPRRSP